ncbi:MAG: DUF1015 domain-containing protein [Treponema sp.]|nr:DUF1015 domain-containing protein [Treponema sp.]
MSSIEERLGALGVAIPEILLPGKLELRQWAVVACDQFTQDRAYWDKAAEAAAGAASTLNLIFPEVFLEDSDRIERIENIHRSMSDYLDTGVFAPPRRGFMYIERDTPFQRRRRGLVAAVDLEQYSYTLAQPLIRPTEGTVSERLPPRMDIRRNAPIETPHILLLIDDDTDALLAELGERAKKNAPAYQGELMLHSGSISGWFLDAADDWAFLAAGLESLARSALTRYGGQPGPQPFLFAVGDGNHSLASAKGIWEEQKSGGNSFSPCRYALVEIENIYDPAIQFEPIHRVVFGVGFEETLHVLSALPGFSSRIINDRAELVRLIAEPIAGNRFGIIAGNRYALVETSAAGIATACLQPLLDKAIAGDKIDYIHGEDELFRVAAKATGIFLPPVQKAGFFETIARSGPLPRKSFSMGEAEEKRFYVECRKL